MKNSIIQQILDNDIPIIDGLSKTDAAIYEEALAAYSQKRNHYLEQVKKFDEQLAKDLDLLEEDANYVSGLCSELYFKRG